MTITHAFHERNEINFWFIFILLFCVCDENYDWTRTVSSISFHFCSSLPSFHTNSKLFILYNFISELKKKKIFFFFTVFTHLSILLCTCWPTIFSSLSFSHHQIVFQNRNSNSNGNLCIIRFFYHLLFIFTFVLRLLLLNTHQKKFFILLFLLLLFHYFLLFYFS